MGRRTPLSRSGSFSLQPAPGGGVTPDCEENQERSRKGVSSWSALTFDLGPPSLSLALHTTLGSSPPHRPPHLHYTCSCSSAVDQSHQRRGQNAGSWAEFEFLTNNPVGFDAVGPLNTL